jgi:UPF0755 protein
VTTEKKSSLAERLKGLRDQIAGVMAAAEEEDTSVAEAASPEEAVAPETEPEKQPAGRRASDDEITSALRRFTWDSPEEEKPEEVSSIPEEVLEESTIASGELEREAFPEKPAEAQEKDELVSILEEFAGTRDIEAEELPPIGEEEKLDALTAAAEESPIPETEEESIAPEEEAGKEDAFAGIADILARLKANRQANDQDGSSSIPEEFFRDPAEESPEETQEEAPAEEVPSGESEYEPLPEDVAKLWEPHSEETADGGKETGEALVDTSQEETHVFTEEDMKNLPHDPETEQGEEELQIVDDEEGYTARDFHPIRRRRYYRSGIAGGIMYFLFVVCISVVLAAFAWLAADDVLSLNKEYKEAVVYVGEDMDVDQVATELQTKGLIRYRRLFTLFGKFFHAEEKIEPGTYTLSTKLDYRALLQNMHHYTGWTGEELATVKVTIPEGKTVMETFQILADHGVCPYETLMECAAKETFDYPFLSDIPDGDATKLEGYLFPDTYEFYADSSPKAAICRFLDNFQERIPERVVEQASELGHTLREIIIVASLIEKEAGSDTERATIASVIYNRLQSTSYPYLQIDATIQYAMGEHKESLTYEDLEVDSPYNTYKYPGLPPGPISNPGLASIRAALNPENTGYYFYALNKNGLHQFFSSYNEFQRFINSSNFGG